MDAIEKLSTILDFHTEQTNIHGSTSILKSDHEYTCAHHSSRFKLKEAREMAGITQLTVASMLGISRASYANIENGKRDPDTSTLIALAGYFDVSVDFLLGRVSSSTHHEDNILRLRELRKSRNLSQRALADYLGCSTVVYSRYETGSREPPLDVLIRISEFYGTTIDYIVGRTTSNTFSTLSEDEIILLSLYQQADLVYRQVALEILENHPSTTLATDNDDRR